MHNTEGTAVLKLAKLLELRKKRAKLSKEERKLFRQECEDSKYRVDWLSLSSIYCAERTAHVLFKLDQAKAVTGRLIFELAKEITRAEERGQKKLTQNLRAAGLLKFFKKRRWPKTRAD